MEALVDPQSLTQGVAEPKTQAAVTGETFALTPVPESSVSLTATPHAQPLCYESLDATFNDVHFDLP